MGEIYKVTNLINNKVYIGQTIHNFAWRYYHHVKSAFNPKSYDYNCPFHYALRKYGVDNFEGIVIEPCDNDLLDVREQYWISVYNSFGDGYNATSGGKNHRKCDTSKLLILWNQGLTCTQIAQSEGINVNTTTVALRLRSIGIDTKSHGNEIIGQQFKKPVYKYNLDGEYLESFPSVIDAARHYENVRNTVKGISGCACGSQKTAFGFIWRYNKSDKIDVPKIKHRNIYGKLGTPVNQYDLTGNFVASYKSVNEATNAVGGKCPSNITNCLSGNAKTAYGYIWKYN